MSRLSPNGRPLPFRPTILLRHDLRAEFGKACRRPTTPGDRIGGHFCAVGFEIIADIFKIAEEVILAGGQLPKIDRIIPEITLRDRFQYAGPRIRVQSLAFLKLFLFDHNYGSLSLHRFRLGLCHLTVGFVAMVLSSAPFYHG